MDNLGLSLDLRAYRWSTIKPSTLITGALAPVGTANRLIDSGKNKTNRPIYSGGATQFDGATQSIAIDTITLTGNDTISFSLSSPTLNGQLPIFGVDRLMVHSLAIQGDFRTAGGDANSYLTELGALSIDTIHHIVICTRDNAFIDTYVDGVLNKTIEQPTSGMKINRIGR